MMQNNINNIVIYYIKKIYKTFYYECNKVYDIFNMNKSVESLFFLSTLLIFQFNMEKCNFFSFRIFNIFHFKNIFKGLVKRI